MARDSRAWRPKAKRWQVAPVFDGAASLARELGTSALVAQVLCNRGIETADAGKAFLNPQLTDLHDPTELPGAADAAKLIARAVRDKRRIVIYGDYDVDGMTATAILHACIVLLGGEADYYVPHRLEEGYGVNPEAMETLIADGAEMIVTVDCGITAVECVAKARAAGVDVIVTDHHSPPAELPAATAVVHPSLPAQAYPNPHLAGAGVAFKVAWQIAREHCGSERVSEPLKDFLMQATCLAALGTIADVVPLLGENRALAAYGLRALPQTPQAGLRALIDSAGLTGKTLDAFDVGFKLAPRLNACGRMGHARDAVEMLTGENPARCAEIARDLAAKNTQRQQIEREIALEAGEMVVARGMNDPEHRAIVLAAENWHGGVIGIVASRLVSRFARPTVLIALDGRSGQGSARSIPGFNMVDALAACGEHLISYGGHAMAGGLRIDAEKIDAFSEAMFAYARTAVADDQLTPTLNVDAETHLAALNQTCVQDLSRLAPFGQGNPAPLLTLRRCRLLGPAKRMGARGQAVNMLLGDRTHRVRAVGFSMGDLADHLAGVTEVDVAAQPVLNTFNGRTSVELHLKDVTW